MDPFIGEIRIWTGVGNFAQPEGWLLCQGQTLQIRSYQALFALIGTTYGGDGVNTFGIPDLRGRFVIGTGAPLAPLVNRYVAGQKGGVETVQLTVNNLAAHTHSATIGSHTHPVDLPAHTHGFAAPAHTHTLSLLCGEDSASTSPNGGYMGNSGNSQYGAATNEKMATQTTDSGGGSSATTASGGNGTVTSGPPSSGSVTVAPAGGSVPVATLSPYMALNFIIAVTGIFPTPQS